MGGMLARRLAVSPLPLPVLPDNDDNDDNDICRLSLNYQHNG
jgi:hypothetical protein